MEDHADNDEEEVFGPVMRVCLYQRISTDKDRQPTSLKTHRERFEFHRVR